MGSTTYTNNRATDKKDTKTGAEVIHDQIAKRAYEIWEKRGRPSGQAKQHWIEAEANLRKPSESSSRRRA